MKKILFTISVTFLALNFLFSQYNIGKTTINFIDSERNDRQIPCAIYYPADIAGNDVDVAAGQFPFIIFGHGFSMGINPYSFFWEGTVPNGVIVIMIDTETGLSPSHINFALDIVYLANNFYNFSITESGILNNKVVNDYFVMGHSMGGGATHLAASYEINPKAIISFAAAETNPSAIEAAANFDGKVIMFRGQNDNVTPGEEHQFPIYENSASVCKTMITINGGIHCYFNNYNFNCWFGETAVGSNAEISREEQQAVVLDFVNLLIQSDLYNSEFANSQYLDSLNQSSRVSVLRDCDNPTQVFNFLNNSGFDVFPNPANQQITVNFNNHQIGEDLKIYNNLGQQIFTTKPQSSEINISIIDFTTGIYYIEYKHFRQKLAIY